MPARHPALRGLYRSLWLTCAGMLAERATRAFWPLWSWGFAVWTALAFGMLDSISVELAFFAALAGGVVFLALLIMGVRQFRWPHRAEVVDRLDATLEGRPLNALRDRQAIGATDAASAHIWQVHLERMRARAARARAVRPDLGMSARDPFALRYLAATGLVAALLFGTIGGHFGTGWISGQKGIDTIAAGPVIEAWIEPPRYTALPTIYLNKVATSSPVPVPEGSRITLRLYGDPERSDWSETVSGETTIDTQPDGNADPGNVAFKVTRSGSLRISGGGENRRWRIRMIPDIAPQIALDGPVTQSLRGSLTLPFTARDDYGVTGGQVRIELDLGNIDRRHGLSRDPEPREAITLDLPLPFASDRKNFSDTIVENLSKHPFAGLPVVIRLSVQDGAGHSAKAEPEMLRLPARRFFDPLAGAIAEQRRDLLWNRDNGRRVAQVLRALSNRPEDLFKNDSAYLMLRSAIRRLEYGLVPRLSDDTRAEVTELLWQTALRIEDGGLSDAEDRLRRAQDRLSEALKNGATDEEIAELTDELRRAMQDYLQQLAENTKPGAQGQTQSGRSREITGDELQAMLDRIEALSRQGRMAQAQQLLEQLRRMMENMQAMRRGQGQGQDGQAMRGLRDTLRQQQGLADDAFRRLQEQFNGENGTPGPAKPGARDLARRQQALRRLLDEQRRELPDANGPGGRTARQSLEQAERDMQAAEEALRKSDLPEALDRQADALDALRQGLENLGREMARDQSPGAERENQSAGNPGSNDGRDPLGRETGTLGRIGTNDTLLPGDDLYLRSRELLDEIRRRSGERARPRIELDYLKRLIDRF